MLLLCIDDDPEDIELFQAAVKLIDENSTFLVAYNGREGLHILEEVLPDFIFLDMNMPIMNGKETLKVIRSDERFASVPVCILSTSNDQIEARNCRELGAARWIVKPSSFRELVTLLKSALQAR